MANWRNDPITEKQKILIEEMHEFSDYPIPVFAGTTKGEASDYIDKWQKKSHISFVSSYEERS